MTGTYSLKEMLAACDSRTEHVVVLDGALKTARTDFQLANHKQILLFLVQFTFDQFAFRGSKPWELRPGSVCDAYTFTDGAVYGYLSFGIPKGGPGKWVIKSLKNDRYALPLMIKPPGKR